LFFSHCHNLIIQLLTNEKNQIIIFIFVLKIFFEFMGKHRNRDRSTSYSKGGWYSFL